MESASIKKAVIIIVSSVFMFFLLHKILQFESVLTNNLKNYENIDNVITKVKKPYSKISNENLIHWDAVHYHLISKKGYDADRVYLFAFFPLFPFLWKLTMLSPLGISILNYLLFSISVFLLCQQLKIGKNIWFLLFLINMPFVAPFIIPYTESLFFLSITIAIIGYLKGNYWLYFIGALLTAMTRSAITIIVLSVLATEFLYILKNKNLKLTVKRFIYLVLPLLIGTFGVLLYQKVSGAESLFTYVDAIKTWDRKLSISNGLSDWSHEGFGLNVATIFFVVPLSIYIVSENIRAVFYPNERMCILNKKNNKEQYLLLLSAVYTIGMFLTNILFQGGSINGLFRYVLCTPFFFVQLIYVIKQARNFNTNSKFLFFLFASFAGVFTMTMPAYSASWGFSDLGFILLILSLALLVFGRVPERKLAYFFPIVLFILNVFWNTFMFNMYLCNGWIFT